MHNLTISEQIKGLKNRDFSSLELTQHYLNRIDNSKLNAFISVTSEQAINQSKMADLILAKGNASSLTGIPYAHKDIFCTKGIKTSAGSKMLDSFISPYDATLSDKLNSQNMVMLGKTNMDEFAMGSSNENSYYGPVKNPWDTKKVPGGSSGGSAAAVASRISPFATGTDTGGSIRQPASLCGIVGLKPTFGSCSRWGIVAFASSLDQAGPLTNCVEDAAHILNSINKYDFNDSTSSNHKRDDYVKDLDKKFEKKIKIGIPSDYLKDVSQDILNQIENAKKVLSQHDIEFVDVEFTTTQYALSTYYILAPAEASSNLARYDGIRYGVREKGENLDEIYLNSRTKGFGDEVTRRILIGAYVLSAGYYDAYYRQAQKVRRLIKNDFERVLKDVDFILTPTTPNEAFKIGDKLDPISMYKNDIYTVPTSLAGLPGVSIPSGLSSNGLPLGIQFIGNYFQEKKLLQLAALTEKELAFNE